MSSVEGKSPGHAEKLYPYGSDGAQDGSEGKPVVERRIVCDTVSCGKRPGSFSPGGVKLALMLTFVLPDPTSLLEFCTDRVCGLKDRLAEAPAACSCWLVSGKSCERLKTCS